MLKRHCVAFVKSLPGIILDCSEDYAMPTTAATLDDLSNGQFSKGKKYFLESLQGFAENPDLKEKLEAEDGDQIDFDAVMRAADRIDAISRPWQIDDKST